MDPQDLDALAVWLTQAGLSGVNDAALHAGFCERLSAAGMPIARSHALIDTLHPVHEGHVFQWNRGAPAVPALPYGRAGGEHGGYDVERWETSPFAHCLRTGEDSLRLKVDAGTAERFSLILDLIEMGMTEHCSLVHRFGSDGVLGAMDCFYVSFTTDRAGGFTDGEVATLRRLSPLLGLAVKAVSLADVAATLVGTYLGRDAGRRVLSGRIERGVADRIEAVLWFSDLRGFTRITDTAPDAVIPLLNDYADVVVSAIEERGGDVLKFMGDGVLAIFSAEACADACDTALAAAKTAHRGVAKLNVRRSGEGKPVSELYLGLHRGEVFYGNIGSRERLDFTVVGPAVNEVSRIATLCRSVDQPLLLSSAFVASLGERVRPHLASVGRFALRGVAVPQELFTVDREMLRPVD